MGFVKESCRTYVLIVYGVGGGVRGFLLLLLVHGVHAALEWQLAVRGSNTAAAISVSQGFLLLLFLFTARCGAA
jgi:hypothetical protein